MLLSYVLFTLALVITPGSTTAVVVRNTLRGGRAAGVATAVGAALANSSHATAAGLGLSLVLARWPSALTVVRAGGGAYLAWLGVSSLARAIRHADGGVPEPAAVAGALPADGRRGFSQGLAVNLLNPAIVTFYLVVVPSFVPAAAPRWWFVLLAAIHVGLAFLCHGLWAFAFDRLRRFFHRPAARRLFEATTGLALIALAARVWWPAAR